MWNSFKIDKNKQYYEIIYITWNKERNLNIYIKKDILLLLLKKGLIIFLKKCKYFGVELGKWRGDMQKNRGTWQRDGK